MKSVVAPYVDFSKSKFARLQERATNVVQAPPELYFEVSGGPQHGSAAMVQQTHVIIGNDVNDDLFLYSDDDVADKIKVTGQKSVLGSLVMVETDRTDVYANGELVKGTFGLERLPISLSYSDLTVVIRVPSDLSDEPETPLFLFGTLMVLGALAIGLLGYQAFAPRSPNITQVALPVIDETNMSIRNESNVAATVTAIADAGLSDKVAVSVTVDDNIVVTGQLSETEALAWTSVQEDIDTRLRGQTIIQRIDVRPALRNVPAIRSVLVGAQGYVVLHDGRKVRPNEVLTENWAISEITSTGLLLSNGDDSVVLNY